VETNLSHWLELSQDLCVDFLDNSCYLCDRSGDSLYLSARSAQGQIWTH